MPRTLKTVLKLDISSFKAGIRNTIVASKKLDRALVRPMANGIRAIGRLTAKFAALGAVVGGFGIKTAGDMQMMWERLKNISAGADDFAKAKEDARKVFMTSPLELQETVDALTLLKAVGIEGEQALRDIGSAAVSMNREVVDVALAINSMQPKVLRRLGITANKVGKEFVFNFRDRAGKALHAYATGIEAARTMALKIMRIKFGGNLARMALMFKGAASTFRGAAKIAIAETFTTAMNELTPLIVRLNKKITEMSRNGTFKRWGVTVGKVMTGIISVVSKAAEAFRNFDLKTWAAQNAVPIVGISALITLMLGVKAVAAVTALIAALAVLPAFVGSALAVIAALFAGFGVGKFLDKFSGITTVFAKEMIRMEQGAKDFLQTLDKIAAFFDGKGFDFKGMREESKRIRENTKTMLSDLHDNMYPEKGDTPGFISKWKKDLDQELKGVMEIVGNVDMAGIKEGVADGVRSASDKLSKGKFGKVFQGMTMGMSERQHAFGKADDRELNRRQLSEAEKMNKTLMRLETKGALVY